MNSIIQFFRLFFAGGALPLGVARRIYTALWLIIAGAVLVVLVGWGFNLAGYRGVSIALSLVLTLLVTILWFEPVRLALVAGVGAVAGALPGVPGTPLSVTQKFLSIYVDILGKVLLWGSILLFITGIVPLGEKPSAIFGIIAGILLLALIQWQWKIGTGAWWKYVFRAYVVAMTTGFAAMLIPGPVWVKYTPLEGNPIYEIGTTSVEQTLFEIRREQAKNKEEEENKILQEILEAVRRKEKLTPEQDKHLLKKEPPVAIIRTSAVQPAPVAPLPAQEAVCDDPSIQARSCLLNTSFSKWMKPAEGAANDGMHLCYSDSESVEYESAIDHGTSLYRFRAKQGQVLMSYKFLKLPEGTLCPQGVV